MDRVVLTASSISELKSNRKYFSVSMRMFSTRANLNKCAVTEAFIDDIIAHKQDYVCMPLCADVSKLKNKDYRGLTHLYDSKRGVFLADEIGGFYDFEKVSDEYGVSLIGYARINKRSSLVCEAIQEMYDQGKLNFSFEISAGAVEVIDGITIVDVHDENELTAMAVVSIPAYPESTALDLVAEANQSIDQFYENAHVLISEIDFETVRERFFEMLYKIIGSENMGMFWPRVLMLCPDCVIFYETHSGRTYKAEYMLDGPELVIKDIYEVKFERLEEGEDEMNDMHEMNQEMESAIEVSEVTEETAVETEAIAEVTETEEVVAETTEQVAETDESNEANQTEEIAEATEEATAEEVAAEETVIDPRIAQLEAELAEYKQYKEELDRIKAEREEAEKEAERTKLAEYVKSNGLNPETELIAEAIKNLDHKALMSELMANTNKNEEKREVSNAVRESCDIKIGGSSYLFERA